MSNASIDSISEFLLHAGTEYRVFDLGRGIVELPSQAFLDIENAITPVPRPRQQHAWFALVFWNKNASEQQYIWFVKFPIDEQGLLVTATRNHFLQIIVDALGSQFVEQTSDEHQKLPDNPYSFVPAQSQMAQFNALVKKSLQQPSANAVEMVKRYIESPETEAWQAIPLQAIHDFVVRLDSNEEASNTLAKHFSKFSIPFQNALMESAEIIDATASLQQCFIDNLNSSSGINLIALRALASNERNETLQQVLAKLLKQDEALSIDLLSVIAGRHYTQMDQQLLTQFFEQAAKLDEQENHNGALFAGFFSDLVQVPQTRSMVLLMLRSTERSEVLNRAIGRLFTQTKGAQH